jgi:putative transposase
MKKRYTDEQFIGFLKQAAAGTPVKGVCPKHGLTHASFDIWRLGFGGMDVPAANRFGKR